MKIRGNTVGTPIKPEKAVVNCQNLTGEEKVQARTNIGAASQDSVSTIEQQLADLLADLNYVNIDITKFSCTNAGTYEIGAVINPPTITWTLNKTPKSQTLNGETLDAAVRSKAYTESVTSSKTYTLTVTGDKGETDKASASITILRGVYYGALNVGAAINSTAINGMSRSLQSGITGTFKMTATDGQKLTFAAPVSYGEPTKFTSGGLDYTWDKVATFEHENSSGHKENYNVWQNSEVTVGTFSVTVVK